MAAAAAIDDAIDAIAAIEAASSVWCYGDIRTIDGLTNDTLKHR